MRYIYSMLAIPILALTPLQIPEVYQQAPVQIHEIFRQKSPTKKINYEKYRNKIVGCKKAAIILRDLGVGRRQRDYAIEILRKESQCNQFARNPKSGAYGIPQSLPASKMASAGADWRWNPKTQLKWFKRYVSERYGTFKNAYRFQLRYGYY